MISKRLRNAYWVMLCLMMACVKHSVAPISQDPPLLYDQAMAAESNPKKIASNKNVSLGIKELQNMRYERAAQEFSRALEIDPENPFAYYYLAETRTKVDRFEEAIELYSQSANYFYTEPQWKAQALSLRGEIYEYLKEYDKAKQSFNSALKVWPKQSRAKQGLKRLEAEKTE